MVTKLSRSRTITVALVGVTTLAGIALWPSLPDRMAIHFSASGTPDDFVPRSLGVFLMPVVMVATSLVLEVAFRIDPPSDERVASVVLVSTMALLTAVQGIVLAWNLGVEISFELVFIGVVCWGLAVAVYTVAREA